MKRNFELLNRDMLYRGFFRLERYRLRHTLFRGGWTEAIERELFRRGDCVAVLLYDPERDCVILQEQFRIGAALRPGQSPWLWEIVAGAVEPSETEEAVARREAMEEAGCEIRDLRLIHRFYTSPGGASEWLSLYLGIVDSRQAGGVFGLDHEHEDILVTPVSFAQAMTMLANGEIHSAIPIIALQWLALQRENFLNLKAAVPDAGA
ncbi:MAG: NUDIX domain-containing protein [Methylococcales bacterium]|nr:NUDIX domain-containing protein [Methylococcales bacterium]